MPPSCRFPPLREGNRARVRFPLLAGGTLRRGSSIALVFVNCVLAIGISCVGRLFGQRRHPLAHCPHYAHYDLLRRHRPQPPPLPTERTHGQEKCTPKKAGTYLRESNQHPVRSLQKQAVLRASRKARAKRGELFRRLLPVSPEDTVLDLGGGDGSHIAAILPEHGNCSQRRNCILSGGLGCPSL